MSSEQIILIAFRLINFGVLVGILSYCWMRWGKGYVKDAYEEQEEYLASLGRTHQVLRKEQTYIKKSITDEDEQRAILKERLFAWREAVKKEHDQLGNALEKRKQHLDERLREQIARVSKHMLYSAVRGQAVQEVKDSFKAKFASKSAQQKFIANILKETQN